MAELGYTEEGWRSLNKGKRWRLLNPEKQRAASAAWLDKNVEHKRTRHRKYQLKKYGLTEATYADILRAQGGLCAICLADTPTGKWKVFAVDHDHATGQVRGLLCNECNRGMGLLKDSATLLRAAAAYLDRSDRKTAQLEEDDA